MCKKAGKICAHLLILTIVNMVGADQIRPTTTLMLLQLYMFAKTLYQCSPQKFVVYSLFPIGQKMY